MHLPHIWAYAARSYAVTPCAPRPARRPGEGWGEGWGEGGGEGEDG